MVYFSVGDPAEVAVTVATPKGVPTTPPKPVIVHPLPVVASANLAVVPTHNDVGPVIGNGLVLTVMVAVVGQPAGDTLVIVVVPAVPKRLQ